MFTVSSCGIKLIYISGNGITDDAANKKPLFRLHKFPQLLQLPEPIK